MRFRWRRRPTRLSRQLAEWNAETEVNAGEWLASLKDTGNDGTDDPPDLGAVAKAHGWVNIDDRCLVLSEAKPEFRHIAGCRCLVAIATAGGKHGC